MDMSILFQSIVGSRLHRTATERSDTDRAVIIAYSLYRTLSPFRQVKTKQINNGHGDVTLYDVRHFIKLATSGNPTVLEAIWSDMVEYVHPLFAELVTHRERLLSAEHVFQAHRGYALSQYHLIVENLGKRIDVTRAGKAAAAMIRVLQQGSSLLRDRTVDYDNLEYRSLIRRLKDEPTEELIRYVALPLRDTLIEELETEYRGCDPMLPDFNWLEDFLVRLYRQL